MFISFVRYLVQQCDGNSRYNVRVREYTGEFMQIDFYSFAQKSLIIECESQRNITLGSQVMKLILRMLVSYYHEQEV